MSVGFCWNNGMKELCEKENSLENFEYGFYDVKKCDWKKGYIEFSVKGEGIRWYE